MVRVPLSVQIAVATVAVLLVRCEPAVAQVTGTTRPAHGLGVVTDKVAAMAG